MTIIRFASFKHFLFLLKINLDNILFITSKSNVHKNFFVSI
jgi:hypothetical protein